MLDRLPPQAPLIGVTNTPGSPLATRATVILLTRAGSENAVSCKTYVTALTVLEALLTDCDPAAAHRDLTCLLEAVSAYLSGFSDYLKVLEEHLRGMQYLVLTGVAHRWQQPAPATTAGC